MEKYQTNLIKEQAILMMTQILTNIPLDVTYQSLRIHLF